MFSGKTSCRSGWFSAFRRTYSSLLAETGNDVKVVQELMRHSKISTTMEVYTQAGMTKNVPRSAGPSMRCLTVIRKLQEEGKQKEKLIAPLSLPRNP
ncbi:tyrosine-type recombinase/integrase [Granulicella mallensis]|uniref:tyrosine-type recombinase/integrase n=1 Tax=Granulicella mallensis TaxID=940614 RepID=UPI0001D9F3C6